MEQREQKQPGTTDAAAAVAATQEWQVGDSLNIPHGVKFKMPLGTVEMILNTPDLKEEIVEVPEWGCSVLVQSFTKATQQELVSQATIAGELNNDRLEILIFIAGVKEPKFSLDQFELIRQKNAAPINRINETIMRLSGMTKEASDKAKESFHNGQ